LLPLQGAEHRHVLQGNLEYLIVAMVVFALGLAVPGRPTWRVVALGIVAWVNPTLYVQKAGIDRQREAREREGRLTPELTAQLDAARRALDVKVDAVGCHASQLIDANDWYASALRDGAEEAGRQAGVRFAEAFRRLELG